MTEIERLKGNLDVLHKAYHLSGMSGKIYLLIDRERDIIRQRIAALEAELAKRPMLESADHLREKLAELTTILNAIPPACPDALALVQARIDAVKKEMQGNE